jgi:hypothetical protein
VLIDDPSDEISAAADKAGVAIIARLVDANGLGLGHGSAAERIAAWALHPSVVLAVVPRMVNMDEAAAIVAAARPHKGTMLVGLEVDGTQPPDAVPAAVVGAADCIVVDLPRDGLPHEGWRSGHSWRLEKPLVAKRAVASGIAAEQRQSCDRMQAALAAWGLADGATQLPWDWAGYLVAAW